MHNDVLWNDGDLRQTDLLLQTAKLMGVSEAEVLALFDLGYDPCEIEELLYTPALA